MASNHEIHENLNPSKLNTLMVGGNFRGMKFFVKTKKTGFSSLFVHKETPAIRKY